MTRRILRTLAPWLMWAALLSAAMVAGIGVDPVRV